MNRTLIRMLDGINQLLAVVIVIACIKLTYDWTANPYAYGRDNTSQLLFALFAGTIGGGIIASVVCGLLAILVEIEGHLRRIANAPAQIAETPAAPASAPSTAA